MKIIDHSPFFNTETGEITFLDRVRAIMKFGSPWIKEVEAQNQIIPVLGKVLDRNYTLLRNVIPPGLEASFPFILVGPTGVFAMYVTPITGMFRAKGDQWGTISGNSFKNEKPNLMTRTEHMARAIQIFLQRQGYLLTSVEAVLLCSDLSVHVDSIRPIIRVVMRDALERFAVSITQARVVLSPEAVQDVINRILNPPIPAPSEPPAEPAAVVAKPVTEPEAVVAESTSAWEAAVSKPITSPREEVTLPPAFAFPEPQVLVTEIEPPSPLVPEPQDLPRAPMWSSDLTPLSADGGQEISLPSKSARLNKSQWAFLIAMFVLWCILVGVFLFVVVRDQWSNILGLMP
jgi:hypothetical protein